MKNKKSTANKIPVVVASKGNSTPTKILNGKQEELSTAILKSFPAYEHLSDSEAEQKCVTIQTYARLLLAYIKGVEKTNTIDNQEIISSPDGSDAKIIAINNETKKIKAA